MTLPHPTPKPEDLGPLTRAALIRVAEAAECLLNATCGDVVGGTIRVEAQTVDALRDALATIPALGG